MIGSMIEDDCRSQWHDLDDGGELPAVGADARQSPAVLDIQRGVLRLLGAHGICGLTEAGLANGRRADIVALTHKGDVWIIEIKSSIEDFRVDHKWPEYRQYCDQMLFAVAPGFPVEIIPADAGLILADRYGGEIIRMGSTSRLAGARRKALTLRLARMAAARLARAMDPEIAASTRNQK